MFVLLILWFGGIGLVYWFGWCLCLLVSGWSWFVWFDLLLGRVAGCLVLIVGFLVCVDSVLLVCLVCVVR